MSDGTDTLDQFAPGTPASEEVETNSLPADSPSDDTEQDLEAEDGQTDEQASSDDEEEVEHGGKKYRIAKDLKPLLMMQADYTRKTQEVAETRKALEAEKEAITQQAARVQELNADRKRLVVLEDWLERQGKVNWAQVIREDPLEGPAKYAEYQHWQSQRNELAQKVEQTEREALETQHREVAKRIEEGRKTLEREIKGWNADTAKKVAEFGIANGLTPQEVSSIHDPRFVKILHAAMLGAQLLQKQQQAAKTATTAPQETVKPLTPVNKGKAPARVGLSDDMSAEEWVKAREQQLRNRK